MALRPLIELYQELAKDPNRATVSFHGVLYANGDPKLFATIIEWMKENEARGKHNIL